MTEIKAHDVTRSWELHERALEVIPMGTQTHSKAPRTALREVEPCFLARGEGCRVWDVDDNEYIDFRCALGPIILGYRFAAVDEAVRRQLDSGMVFSYPHPLEVEVAEALVEIIPCAEAVRFLKTGGEAMAAVHRLARAFTGRDMLLTCGYHGWVNTMSRDGVPEGMQAFYQGLPWGSIEPYEQAFAEAEGQIAAVSVACSYADIELGHTFLPALRALTEKHGALLIFDEIVTGFRLQRGGAQEYFGVLPDLAVFAKGISNGVPLSCFVGRKEVMQQVKDVVISSTYGGDTLGLAAAQAVLETYKNEDVIGHIWTLGQHLHQGFAEICTRLDIAAGFKGVAPLGLLSFDYPDAGRNAELFLRFNGEVLRRGLIIYSVCYVNYSHTREHIDTALAAMEEALLVMKYEGLFD